MKKLLALILCVMLFVSVIPTAAFAADAAARASGKADNPLLTAAEYKKEIANMVKNTKKSIESAYGVLTMDQVVYASAKGMDDVLVALVNGIADDLIADGAMTKAEATAITNSVRELIDGMVAKKIAANAYKYTDGTSKDPIAYAQVFADAVASVLTDKNFQKGYEDVATYFAMVALVDNINTELAKQYAAFAESVDVDFDDTFTKQYTQLVAQYVDTFAEGLEAPEMPWDVAQFSAVGSIS